jgi:hydroxyquinol 1,2-dioxygenase
LLHAESYEPLVTMLFWDGDPYLDCDVVFGVKRSLVADFVQHQPGVAPDGTYVDELFRTLEWAFTLVPKGTQRQENRA